MANSAPHNIGVTPKKNGQATRSIANSRRDGKRLVAKKNRREAKEAIAKDLEEG